VVYKIPEVKDRMFDETINWKPKTGEGRFELVEKCQ
jgi:hypothetical protein